MRNKDDEKVSVRWVPGLLSSIQNNSVMVAMMKLLQLYSANQRTFLLSILTGEETKVLYYNPLSMRESMEWRKLGEVLSSKAKVLQSTKKVIATLFWNTKTILMINFKPRSTTVNGDYNTSLLY